MGMLAVYKDVGDFCREGAMFGTPAPFGPLGEPLTLTRCFTIGLMMAEELGLAGLGLAYSRDCASALA